MHPLLNLLSLSKTPCHLANHNLSKSGTLLQAPTLVHKLHTSQVFAYKVRLGVYPPLTLSLSKRPCHLANHNLSKPGTLLQAPTLVHKLHTSQVFAYKVRLGVYPPLTLALSKTPCLHESLQVWNTLVASNTYAYAPHIPSLCIQGETWCVSSSHLVSSSNTILEAPQGPCHIT